MEICCADILHEINENFKEAYLIRHREIKITCKKGYRCFDFVVLVNKNIASLRVKHSFLLTNDQDSAEIPECIFEVEE